jgi:hypothetical protein
MPSPTPVPTPVTLSGSGDSVVNVAKWEGPAIVHITYNGGRNFAVWNYDADGKMIDLLVNTIGRYEGTRPLDFLGEHTTRFVIKSSGPWEIQVLPLQRIRRVNIPGTFQGKGDDVVYLQGAGKPDVLKVDASKARSNFVIWAYGKKRDLVVNEIAPYTGVTIVDMDTFLLVIEAEGNWSIEVTTR